MALIRAFQVFGLIYVMARDLPVSSTHTIVYHIYHQGWEVGRMGYACALSWVLFAAIFVLTAVQWRLRKHWVTYE